MRNWDVAMVDPPWDIRMGGKRKGKRADALPYPTLSVPDCFSLLDRDILTGANPTHTVFLWEVDKILIETEQEMLKRGYKRHCRFVWDKLNGFPAAFTVRFSHEYLVWWYKPKMIPINPDMRGKPTTVFAEGAREHSRKPECAYKLIESLYSQASKVDVFSRQKREGWEQFGNQTEHFK